jgi:hypothetical protein
LRAFTLHRVDGVAFNNFSLVEPYWVMARTPATIRDGGDEGKLADGEVPRFHRFFESFRAIYLPPFY